MRRKIHEAFRSKVKTEEDERASVSSEDSNSIENEGNSPWEELV